MDRSYALCLLCLLTLVALLCPPIATAAPITSNTALPVHEGELIVRAQGKFIRSTDDPSGAGRELSVRAAPTVLVYGASDKLALFSIFPYLDKRLELDGPGGRKSRGASGLGDIRLIARYTVGQWDGPQETLRLAPFLGLEAPSGGDNARDSLGRLPQPLQLGSGSWDLVFGTVFTWQRLACEFDASASYKLNTEANDFDFGDVAGLDLSFQYRLSPLELERGVPSFLYAVAESNLTWQGRNEVQGSNDEDSGGVSWFLAPGLQFVTKRFILEAALQLPVIQDLNGVALENDFVMSGGLRANF